VSGRRAPHEGKEERHCPVSGLCNGLATKQIERGETVPYSKELMEQIGQRAKQGKKIDNPDVLS